MTRFFQIGFNRCGTTSIHSFFEANGIPSIHYDDGRLATTMFDNLDQGRFILRGYEGYNAFTDMEYLTHSRYYEGYKLYRPIMEQVPDAKFILNVRDPDRWIMSRLIHPAARVVPSVSPKRSSGGARRFWQAIIMGRTKHAMGWRMLTKLRLT